VINLSVDKPKVLTDMFRVLYREEALGVDRDAVHHEMEQARLTFNDLVSKATPADLRRHLIGTRWTTCSCCSTGCSAT
jgi:hypothetical protein